MSCSWGRIYTKLTKKTTRLDYDSFVMAIQSLLDSECPYPRVPSQEHIDQYVLRICAPPKSDKALLPHFLATITKEGGCDDDGDDNHDDDQDWGSPNVETSQLRRLCKPL